MQYSNATVQLSYASYHLPVPFQTNHGSDAGNFLYSSQTTEQKSKQSPTVSWEHSMMPKERLNKHYGMTCNKRLNLGNATCILIKLWTKCMNNLFSDPLVKVLAWEVHKCMSLSLRAVASWKNDHTWARVLDIYSYTVFICQK